MKIIRIIGIVDSVLLIVAGILEGCAGWSKRKWEIHDSKVAPKVL